MLVLWCLVNFTKNVGQFLWSQRISEHFDDIRREPTLQDGLETTDGSIEFEHILVHSSTTSAVHMDYAI